MQWVMTSHVRRYHCHYGTNGHVWQGRYKSFIIQDNDHLLTVARNIEANPVRAGLTEHAVRWPWSSHAARGATTNGMHPDSFPVLLPEDWASYIYTPLTDAELHKLRNSVNRQSLFVKEDWKDEMCLKLGLESTVRPRGWQ